MKNLDLQKSFSRLNGDEQSRKTALFNILSHCIMQCDTENLDGLRKFADERKSNALDLFAMRKVFDQLGNDELIHHAKRVRGIKCANAALAFEGVSQWLNPIIEEERQKRREIKIAAKDAANAAKGSYKGTNVVPLRLAA